MTSHRTSKQRATARWIDLRITLLGSDPEIWRRMAVARYLTLADLHVVLQVAFGWDDSHQHLFEKNRIRYGDPERGLQGVVDEMDVDLLEVLPRKGSKLLYRYDFGDQWDHEIVHLGPSPEDHGDRISVCLDGARAAPPEDSGGVWGYQEALIALTDPDHPQFEDACEWFGIDPNELADAEGDYRRWYDPEAFDKDDVTARLAALEARDE